MLVYFIVAYILFTLAVGLLAARFVNNTGDFIVAGHQLPLGIATLTVFATWFGSETILGASANFADAGIQGVIEDPFGAALCLFLIALFFAKRLYRLDLLTFGDFYRQQYGRRAELVAGIALVVSYLGWIAAQMVAMGILLSTLSGIDKQIAITGAAAIVILYTVVGGMWAVSITDTIQSVVIIVGLIWAMAEVLPLAGGFDTFMDSLPAKHLDFWPALYAKDWLVYIGAWLTIGLGSIPQQDVYQRVMASKNEKVAVYSTWIAGILYLTIGLIPLALGHIAHTLLAGTVPDNQELVPTLILHHTSFIVQVMFFGALVSAIMSTASGAMLAPAAILSENLLKPLLKITNDKQLLLLTRASVLATGIVALAMALFRQNIYQLVGESSAISLVALFVPLVAGLFGGSRHELAAITAMLVGFVVWVIFNFWFQTIIPAILIGFAASALAFWAVKTFLRHFAT